MTRRRSVWVAPERNVILCKGWRIGDLLREGGWRPIYLGSLGAWSLDSRHLEDVVAYFESRRMVVHLSDEHGPGEAA